MKDVIDLELWKKHDKDGTLGLIFDDLISNQGLDYVSCYFVALELYTERVTI